MKKLILINSYCDSPAKVDILNLNLDILRENNFEILLFSGVNLSQEITKKCNFYFYSTDNPISVGKEIVFWKNVISNNKNIKLNRFWKDYAYGAVNQFKNLCNIASFLDYDKFYFVQYDLIITNDVLNFIKSEEEDSFFVNRVYQNYNVIETECPALFLLLSKDKISIFNNLLNLEYFQKFSSIEDYFKDISLRMGIRINRDFILEDHIYTFRHYDNDFFNLSPWDDFSIFFAKNAYSNEDEKSLLLYNFIRKSNLTIRINDNIEMEEISDTKIFKIDDSINRFEIWFDGKIFDVLKSLKSFSGGWWEINN